jgi:tRNA (guanine37-N1)-methyltransferase
MKLKQALRGRLIDKEMEILKRSFDVVGNIAIIEMPDELRPSQRVIADAIMEMNKNIKTVLKKASMHEGKYRTQRLKYIVGKRTKETVHKENNVMLKLNVETSYFSPRSSTERKRIMGLVEPGEDVLVMFSGIGPFCMEIAKNAKPRCVYGVEINPEAHRYAQENVRLNKLEGKVKLYNGDVRDVVPGLKERFDRIVMPLPKDADTFLDTAFKAAKKGTIIHLYLFLEKDRLGDGIKRIEEICAKHKKSCKILGHVMCGQYSPSTFRTCIDFQMIDGY